MVWKALVFPSCCPRSVIVSAAPLAVLPNSAPILPAFFAISDFPASSKTSVTFSLRVSNFSFKTSLLFEASDSTVWNFVLAFFKASDCSNFCASSRNFLRLSFISLFFAISCLIFSINCEKKLGLLGPSEARRKISYRKYLRP
uniref:Uncharacterized protein n=1 Tax=Panstrongylus lignarius TaxID=156445 RepID=A0A224XSC1_9HEMI